MTVWNSPSLLDRLVRPLATTLQRMLKLVRSEPERPGVHALALTPDRKIILVLLRYAPCWRLPGGGRSPSEDHRAAVRRELREEIGMNSHGAIRVTAVPELLIVEDIRYTPRKWSWEVEAIMEAELDNLPGDLSPRTAAWIEAVRGEL